MIRKVTVEFEIESETEADFAHDVALWIKIENEYTKRQVNQSQWVKASIVSVDGKELNAL